MLVLEVLNVIKRIKKVGGPESRRASALPATREKLKIEGEVFSGYSWYRRCQEKWSRAFVIFKPQDPARWWRSSGAWCCREADDQYGMCDLRTGGLKYRRRRSKRVEGSRNLRRISWVSEGACSYIWWVKSSRQGSSSQTSERKRDGSEVVVVEGGELVWSLIVMVNTPPEFNVSELWAGEKCKQNKGLLLLLSKEET